MPGTPLGTESRSRLPPSSPAPASFRGLCRIWLRSAGAASLHLPSLRQFSLFSQRLPRQLLAEGFCGHPSPLACPGIPVAESLAGALPHVADSPLLCCYKLIRFQPSGLALEETRCASAVARWSFPCSGGATWDLAWPWVELGQRDRQVLLHGGESLSVSPGQLRLGTVPGAGLSWSGASHWHRRSSAPDHGSGWCLGAGWWLPRRWCCTPSSPRGERDD